MNIAVFASGGGTNFENIVNHFNQSGTARVTLMLCNNSKAGVLERATRLGVESQVLNRAQFNDENVLMPLLREHNIDFIVLAGFLLMVPGFLIDAYDRRMINLHPALLPRHGGKGMYGHHVHEAVIADGDTETGITIHYVSRVCDGGEIIAQFSTPVNPGDTADDVAASIHILEQAHFPNVIEQVIANL